MEIQCPETDVLLKLVETPEALAPDLRTRLETHLSECTHCCEYVETLERQASGIFSFFRFYDSQNSQEIGIDERTTTDEALELPFTIGAYEAFRLIGHGGMGDVYEARHKFLKRTAAIKLIRRNRRFNSQAIAQFQKEIEAAGLIQSPFVVAAYDAGEYNNIPFLAMEQLHGETLKEYVNRKGTLVVEEACQLVLQAARGLQAIHDQGLVHRDIKPGNIWRTKEGQIKILDFGLAVFQNGTLEMKPDEETGFEISDRRQTIAGTPDYMSPEQCLGLQDIDARSDIYSLGVVFYFLLTGIPPFEGKPNQTFDELIKDRLIKSFPHVLLEPSTFPKQAQEILDRMTARDRDERYASCCEVVSALESFLAAKTRGAQFRTWLGTGLVLALALGVAVDMRGCNSSQNVPDQANKLSQKATLSASTAVSTQQTSYPVTDSQNKTDANVHNQNVPETIFGGKSELVREQNSGQTPETTSGQSSKTAAESFPSLDDSDAEESTGTDVQSNIELISENSMYMSDDKDVSAVQNRNTSYEEYLYDQAIDYLHGIIYPKDEKAAFELFLDCAQRGYAPAKVQLGICYQNGIGTEVNERAAVQWIEAAAHDKYSAGLFVQGKMYAHGVSYVRNKSKAVALITEAARLGWVDAQLYLGRAYSSGEMVEVDNQAAVVWFKRAAAQNSGEACFLLGKLYESEQISDKENSVVSDEAEVWYLKAAGLDYAPAQLRVGRLFEQREEYEQAFDWYEKAAHKNLAEALTATGRMFLNGLGTKADLELGFTRILQAARLGDSDGAFHAGECYRTGTGTRINLNKAVFWLQKAALESSGAKEILNDPEKNFGQPQLPEPLDDSLPVIEL